MNFQQVIEYESAHAGSKFKRKDGDEHDTNKWFWGIGFDQENAGRLYQFTLPGVHPVSYGRVELYHHDLMDGDWEVYEG